MQKTKLNVKANNECSNDNLFKVILHHLIIKYFSFCKILSDAKWWVLHRTTHKFHVLNLNIEPGYYNLNAVLEAAMWRCLILHVEKERGGLEGLRKEINFIKKECKKLKMKIKKCRKNERKNKWLIDELKSTKKWLNTFQSIEDIYVWCTQKRPELLKETENLIIDFKGKSAVPIENELQQKDNEMLKLLVDIRGSLWV